MNGKSPFQEVASNPRFAAVLDKCLDEEELIEQFERISGVTRPRTPRNGIEAMVDEVTGFRESQWKDFFEAFIPFAWECVWLRWAERDNEEFWQ
jgi:hypothetical protein